MTALDEAHQALRTMNLVVDDYRARIDAVLALHVEGDVPENGFTQGWGMKWCESDHEPWPCRTRKLLRGQPG